MAYRFYHVRHVLLFISTAILYLMSAATREAANAVRRGPRFVCSKWSERTVGCVRCIGNFPCLFCSRVRGGVGPLLQQKAEVEETSTSS